MRMTRRTKHNYSVKNTASTLISNSLCWPLVLYLQEALTRVHMLFIGFYHVSFWMNKDHEKWSFRAAKWMLLSWTGSGFEGLGARVGSPVSLPPTGEGREMCISSERVGRTFAATFFGGFYCCLLNSCPEDCSRLPDFEPTGMAR